MINGKIGDMINGGLTFLFGGGVGSSVMIVTLENVDTALRLGVFIITIIVGIVKTYYMIKYEGKSKGGK